MNINELITAKSIPAKVVYSVAIISASLLIPYFSVPEGFWGDFILNYKTIIFLSAYGVVVIGYVLIVFDVRVFDITPQTKESHNEINEIIIKPNRKKAIKRNAPIFTTLLAFGAFITYISYINNPNCSNLLGFNVSYLNIIFITYAIPVLFFILSIWFARTGFIEVKYGYSPPLDTPVFFKTIVVKTGKWVKVKGVIAMLAPIYAVYLLYIGDVAYSGLIKGSSYSEIINRIESKCTSNA